MGYLEQPIQAGMIRLKNRLVMAPVDLQKSDRGTVTEEQVNYYDERTRGGNVGLVVLEHSFVRANGRAGANQISCAKDEDISGLSRIAETIHRNGSRAVMQLAHAGMKAGCSDDGLMGFSPSGTPEQEAAASFRPTKAMTKDDIEGLIESYRNAAVRAEKAGFDGVEIHGAHGYLLSQFYSPLTNHREDEYNGQTIEGRTKLHCEILSAVRDILGRDKVVGIRFGACDYREGGSTIEDGAKAAKRLEEAGAEFIDVSGGLCGSRPEGWNEVGYFRDSAKAVRNAVAVPVILAGGVKTREDAEMLLSEGAADLIAVARSIVADPLWADKAMNG